MPVMPKLLKLSRRTVKPLMRDNHPSIADASENIGSALPSELSRTNAARPGPVRIGMVSGAPPRLVLRRALMGTALLIVLTASGRPVRAGDDAPDWLRAASSQSLPSFANDVPAVVIRHEGTMAVDSEGKVVFTERWAIKILQREGRQGAIARAVYETDSEKVRDIQAWIIRKSGTVKRYKKDQVIDAALVQDDLYNEARKRLIDATDDVDEGDIFGYEAVVERRQVFTQFEWYFQDSYPVVSSKVILNLPPGWTAQAVTFNHAKVEPSVSGSAYSWELRDLPYVEDEPASPSAVSMAPTLAVSYYPPDAAGSTVKPFHEWSDVSAWMSQLADPQSSPDDAISQKARSLTAGAATEMDKIKAIASYVQSVRYVSIQTGVGRGGGYRPHMAADIFAKSYGDCKDKANLMRAMLKAVGIQAFPVSISATGPLEVRKEWPSPQQFNHCIIAIKVGSETQAATVIDHPTIGRLLIFDPTDEDTTVGDLPEPEQGSLALIIAGNEGRLVRMPAMPPEANLIERAIDVTLNADGSLAATLTEHAIGQSAADMRGKYNHLDHATYVRAMERWITTGVAGASVPKVDPKDDRAANRFTLELQFSADRYAQPMQNRLLLFRPAMVPRQGLPKLTHSKRTLPVELDPYAVEENVKVKLPDGFDVDELPDPVKVDAPFGYYTATYQAKDGYLLFNRKLVTRSAVIPADNYASVSGFFDRVRSAEQTPVVLARK